MTGAQTCALPISARAGLWAQAAAYGERAAAKAAARDANVEAVGFYEQALTWLERAVAGRVQRPAAYVALAELRLQRFAAQNPLSPLPVTETTAVWALLKQADAMRPRLVGTYGLALAMWRNSMLTPTAADLALLADGIDAFSGEITLVRDAFSLANKLGPAVDPDFLARLDTWTRRLGYSRLTL